MSIRVKDDILDTNGVKKKFTFRFYAELNDFLPADKRQKRFVHSFKTPISVRETLISLGIPLSEVDLILVNEKSVDFEQKLKEGDNITVYPVFESMDISTATKIRKRSLRNTTFILDAHLGKLAKYLRMLGFDSLYRADFDDDEIIELAKKEKRIILTRDKLLLKSKEVTHGYYVRSIDKHDQLREVVKRFDLPSQFRSFTRCMTCNEKLVKIDKEKNRQKIDTDTFRLYEDFFFCSTCNKVFWRGSHFKRMEELILTLINA